VGKALRSPGWLREEAAPSVFEARFGSDFSGVPVHLDSATGKGAAAHSFGVGRVRDRLTTLPGDRDEMAAQRARPAGQTPLEAICRDSLRNALPPSVAAVLGRPGRALDPSTRERFGLRPDPVFDAVRLHVGAAGDAAARELQATAFTFGRHIVLRSGYEGSRTPAGEPLLVHELGHVVSPPVGALIGRQASPAPARAEDPDAVLGRWLDEHQLAPPEQQPAADPSSREVPERHVLLNGEEMPISRASALAAAAVGQPVPRVRAFIERAVSRAVPSSALGAPFVGAGNTVPGIHLNVDDPLGLRPQLGKAADLQSIDEWLERHDFRPPDIRDPTGRGAYLDGEPTTIDAVARRIMALYTASGLGGINISYLTRQEILDHLRQRYVSARGGPQTQIVFGYTLIPSALQATTSPPNPTQHQFSFTITRQHHPGDSPGRESSFQGAVTLDAQGNILNLQAGGQEAVVAPLLRGWIQVSGFVQTMVAVNWNRPATGSVSITPSVQQAVGGQVLVTPTLHGGPFRFLSGHIQVGVQVVGQVNIPLGSAPASAGVQGGFILNIPF
jgi:hypothetical protein